jgi:hypothetical protein
MGAIATAFINAFKLAANTDPADCQALGATVETYVAAPRTHNANAAAAPTSSPAGTVLRSIGADAANAGYALDAFGGAPTIRMRRANGTGAAPTAVLNGDLIATIVFSGYYTAGGPGYAAFPSSVRSHATENWSSTAQGAKLVFAMTPNGAAAPVDAWAIDQDKSLLGLGKLGYAIGVGGAVTQVTDKSTGVTLNKLSGEITLNNAALAAATIVSFVLTNSVLEGSDVMILNHSSGGTPGAYSLNARCAAGSATIDVRNNTAGSLGEAIVIRYAVIRGVIS